MNPRDIVHKTVLKPGGTKKPSPNASDGRHQKRNILAPLHSRSPCRLQALGVVFIVFELV
jgi:hypothetical protein